MIIIITRWISYNFPSIILADYIIGKKHLVYFYGEAAKSCYGYPISSEKNVRDYIENRMDFELHPTKIKTHKVTKLK